MFAHSLVRILLCGILAACATPVLAREIVIIDAPVNGIDKRNDFTNRLLATILKKTEAKYGSFEIRYAPAYLYRDRLFAELLDGKIVNVTAKATRPDWEDSRLLTVRIPVDKGITEYRLFLINQDDQARFRRIESLEELKQLTLGVGHAWSTKGVFQAEGFKLEAVVDWESLYKMLEARRIDYLPRALSEIFVEYDDRHASYPRMAIEDSLAIYFPLPKYFFVSPQHPQLARRIEEGFQAMIRDGSFDKLFLAYHQKLIDRANFCGRRLLRFANPQLSPQTPLDHPEYWYTPSCGSTARQDSRRFPLGKDKKHVQSRS